jgi:anti-sigma regulatory factor (Ser/Thr protein kinase)
VTASMSGGTGTVRVAMRSGVRPVTESSTPVPVPPPLIGHHELANRLAEPHLEMNACRGAVPIARHHARQLLWDLGLKELVEPVELVVSEIVTNAVRASGGLDEPHPSQGIAAIVRLWLSVEADDVLVLVWDGSPLKPERQELRPDATSGRGLLLVELFSAAWGSFELAHEPGKVVWALCQS